MRVVDLNLAKTRFLERLLAKRRVQSEDDRTKEPVLRELLRRRLRALHERHPVEIMTPDTQRKDFESTSKALLQLERWAEQRTTEDVSSDIRKKLIEILKQMETK